MCTLRYHEYYLHLAAVRLLNFQYSEKDWTVADVNSSPFHLLYHIIVFSPIALYLIAYHINAYSIYSTVSVLYCSFFFIHSKH